MSNVSIKSSGKKFFIYIAIISTVIIINIYSNRKYILNNFIINSSHKIELEDSKVKALIEPTFYKKQVKVLSGHSIDSLLLKEDINETSVIQSSRALKKVFEPRDLRAGAKVTISYDWSDKTTFLGYEIDLGYDKSVTVKKEPDGTFLGQIIDKSYFTKIFKGKGVINSSLYQAAQDQGVSPNVIMNLIQLYSFDVDFQRDIQNGTEFEIIYENYTDDLGNVVKHGNILAASLKFSDRRFPIYRYTTVDGKTDYYNEVGKSARKALLKTPVNGAWISSGFGNRQLVEGYTSFHRGTDFAVKSGTPIYASGDGVISRSIVSYKGYGIHIMIRHPNGYETLYAHMSSHARGMNKGTRVTQGQVIGYVGSTGNSTGPHLHYETRYNGQYVNPSSIKIPPGRSLKGEELESFQESIKKNILSI